MSWRRWAPWALLAVVVAGALAVGASDGGAEARGVDDRVRALAGEVACPTCRGQSVLESDAPTATAIKAEIRRRVEAGESDDDIRAYLVTRFGPGVLLTPESGGLTGLVWVLPVVGLVLGLAGLAWAFQRWRPEEAPPVDAVDRALVERARHRGGEQRSSGGTGP